MILSFSKKVVYNSLETIVAEEKRVNTYKTINEILVLLFNEIWELEGKAIITDEYRDITNNDMHIIEAVGLGEGKPMSAIAKKLNVTAGTLSTSMNSLVKKGYVVRKKSEVDRRVVLIQLTEQGQKAYHHHEEFHHEMVDAVIKSLDKDEIPTLLKTLHSLTDFFRKYQD